MTSDVNGYYGVTVIHGEKVWPRRWRARAYIFRRDTQKKIGKDLFGEGATMTSADNQAYKAATRSIHMIDVPKDWSGPEGGFPLRL